MTPTQICNLALSILKCTPINDIDSNDAKADLCKRWYNLKRQNLLAEHNWRFAIKKLNLPKNQDDNFVLPSDLIRVISFSDENAQQIGNEIISNNTELKIWYIKDIEDSFTFTSDFINVFSLLLGYTLSFELVGDKSITNSMRQQYLEELQKVKSNLEYPFKNMQFKSNIISARYV